MKTLITIIIMLVAVGCGQTLFGAPLPPRFWNFKTQLEPSTSPNSSAPTTEETVAVQKNGFLSLVLSFVVIGSTIWLIWRYLLMDTDRKILGDTISQKSKLPKIKFEDSGWVLVYVICGWISCVGGIIILFVGLASDHKDSNSEAFIYFCSALLASLSCFFAAHVLRLQEKTAHHVERTADAIERLEKKTKDE